MDDSSIIFSQVQAPPEDETVDESIVKLQRRWAFWENYDPKTGSGAKLDYAQSLKEIFRFDDIITFWQFWNQYPGSVPSNVFYNGERLR
jgi:hypothetical protein